MAALTKAEAAKKLAEKHYALEDGLIQIFLVKRTKRGDESDEPIKLLEVNQATVPSGVMPLHFGPLSASGIPFPSTIVEVTPDEFTLIKQKKLKLPPGWVHFVELPKPSGDGE